MAIDFTKSGVDWKGVPESEGFDALPDGLYKMEATDFKDKATKNNDGKYYSVEFTVCDGEKFAGRKIWHNFNYENKSAEAQQIGCGQFKNFVKCATGKEVEELGSSDELIKKPLLISLGVRKSDQYGDQNNIKSFRQYKKEAVAKDSTPQRDDDNIPF